MQTQITMPELGVTASPARLSIWFADRGDLIAEGDRIVEVLLDGATFDVPAPASGRLVEIHAYPDDPLQPGQVLGVLQSSDDESGEDDATELDLPST